MLLVWERNTHSQRSRVSSAPIEAHTLQLSDSEELDAANARDTEDSPPQSRAYEELVEVVTRAVEKLNIDWTAEREDVRSRGTFYLLVHSLNAGDYHFFLISTPRCEKTGKNGFL